MAIIDPNLLLRAYSIGVFPMADSREAPDVFWVEPKRRAILPLERFRMARSLRKTLRSGVFDVTVDRAFAAVVRHCAARPETWINAGIEGSYNQLHRQGHAHSKQVSSAGRKRRPNAWTVYSRQDARRLDLRRNLSRSLAHARGTDLADGYRQGPGGHAMNDRPLDTPRLDAEARSYAKAIALRFV